jgi:hypothetical protein
MAAALWLLHYSCCTMAAALWLQHCVRGLGLHSLWLHSLWLKRLPVACTVCG